MLVFFKSSCCTDCCSSSCMLQMDVDWTRKFWYTLVSAVGWSWPQLWWWALLWCVAVANQPSAARRGGFFI